MAAEIINCFYATKRPCLKKRKKEVKILKTLRLASCKIFFSTTCRRNEREYTYNRIGHISVQIAVCKAFAVNMTYPCYLSACIG